MPTAVEIVLLLYGGSRNVGVIGGTCTQNKRNTRECDAGDNNETPPLGPQENHRHHVWQLQFVGGIYGTNFQLWGIIRRTTDTRWCIHHLLPAALRMYLQRLQTICASHCSSSYRFQVETPWMVSLHLRITIDFSQESLTVNFQMLTTDHIVGMNPNRPPSPFYAVIWKKWKIIGLQF